jgi:hypothetical protein
VDIYERSRVVNEYKSRPSVGACQPYFVSRGSDQLVIGLVALAAAIALGRSPSSQKAFSCCTLHAGFVAALPYSPLSLVTL